MTDRDIKDAIIKAFGSAAQQRADKKALDEAVRWAMSLAPHENEQSVRAYLAMEMLRDKLEDIFGQHIKVVYEHVWDEDSVN